MLRSILVPLDGSVRAEQSLPVAAHLARSSQGALHLVRVVDLILEGGIYTTLQAPYRQEILDVAGTNAREYLERIASRPLFQGLKVRRMVAMGDPVTQLLDLIQSSHFDLVILCSHGYTGLQRWAYGSVAHHLMRQSSVPLLLLHHQNTFTHTLTERPFQVVIALDGSPFAEASLLPALRLAQAWLTQASRTLQLLQIVPPPKEDEESSIRRYGLDIDLRSLALTQAQQYLETKRTQLQQHAPKIPIETQVEESQDIAGALLEHVQHTTSSNNVVLALTTHGRNFLQRRLLGSVTERIFGHTHQSLLIVHPQPPANAEQS